jgi:hypothetical protein
MAEYPSPIHNSCRESRRVQRNVPVGADSNADVSTETENKLLQLYHPSIRLTSTNAEVTDQRSEEEEAIVKLFATAMEYLTSLVRQ